MTTRETEAPKGDNTAISDPKRGLDRLADLTRRVIAVPKDEVPPIFSKPKRRAKRKRHH